MIFEVVTLLVLLNLSAAFKTIDHTILIGCLENLLGIKDSALSWIKSYLSNRTQSVLVNREESDAADILYGVP